MVDGNQPKAKDGFTVEDVEFLRHGDTVLLARIYRPLGAGPFPGLIDVHGGGWNHGDRLNNDYFGEALAKAGFVVASVDFRQPPEASYPASVADINYGVRWLKREAANLGIIPGRLGALGSSSGGHQVMLVAMRPRDPRYAAIPLAGGEGIDASLDYVVSCWGILDPLTRYHMAKAKGKDSTVAGHDAFWITEAAMAEGNPQMILDRREAALLPPVLLINGTNDDNWNHEWSDRFVASYRKAGGSAELHKYEGEVHSFVSKDLTAPAAIDAIEQVRAFIARQTER